MPRISSIRHRHNSFFLTAFYPALKITLMQLDNKGMGAAAHLQDDGKHNPYKKLMQMVQLILAITIAAIAAMVTIYYIQ
jgi:TPP-dependent trihydroxycyclohexane-1,2-dione (THcHDO) dehydratase